MKKIWLIPSLLVFIISCQAPLFDSKSKNVGIAINLAYAPVDTTSSGASSRLLLPTSSFIQVTLTDIHGKKYTQSKGISGLSVLLNFDKVPIGRCTVEANAYNNSTMSVLLFSNTVNYVAGAEGSSLSMNLLPASYIALNPGNNNGALPNGATSFRYNFSSSVDSLVLANLPGVSYYLQNSQGALITDIAGAIKASDLNGSLFLTLYNTGSASSYSFNMVDTSNGLQIFYPFNNNTVDLGGNKYNASPTAITYIADHSGNPSAAASFNGSNSIISGASGMVIPTRLTVSCWVKITNNTGLAYFIRSNSGGFGIFQNGTSLGIAISLPSTNSAQSASLSYGWHHVAGTYDQSTIRLYIDGSLSNSQAWAGTISDSGPIVFGLFNTTYWPGAVDGFRLFNRVLSDSEIAALANAAN